MKAHIKRLNAPKTWDVKKKAHTWVVRARPSGISSEFAVPLLLLFREELGKVNTAKEFKYVLRNSNILLNGKKVTDHKTAAKLFDVISIPDIKENYRVVMKNGNLTVIPIDEKEANLKVMLLKNKSYLRSKKDSKKDAKATKSKSNSKSNIQLNLFDGINLYVEKEDDKYKTGNAILFTLDKKEVKDVYSVEKDSYVFVLKGKYKGKVGTVKSMGDEVVVKIGNDDIHVEKSYLMPLGKKLAVTVN